MCRKAERSRWSRQGFWSLKVQSVDGASGVGGGALAAVRVHRVSVSGVDIQVKRVAYCLPDAKATGR